MDNFEMLQQLKQLLDEGILTPEEYEKSKAQILFPEKQVYEVKVKKNEKLNTQIIDNVTSTLKEKKPNKKVIIIGVVCAICVVVLLIVGSVIRSNRAEQEQATIQAYKESLSNKVAGYTYRDGKYHHTFYFDEDGDYYYITNDGVFGAYYSSFLTYDDYFGYYTGHNYYSIMKDSKGYYVNTNMRDFEKMYLPNDPSISPSSLTDSDGHTFQ